MKDTGERLIPEGNTQTLTYGEHLSRYLSVLDMVKDKVVLDVASGSGYGSQLLATSAKTVVGLDNSEEAVEYAKKRYPAKNLTYKVGDAMDMSLEDGMFDVVISLETIEHLHDPGKFVKEVKRVLKPEGVFVVSTPNDDEFMDGNEFHVHEFQLAELERLIKQNFKHEKYYFQGTYFTSGIFTRDDFEKGVPATHKINSVLTFGQPVDKAIYYIAVASDAPSPKLDLTTNITIADRWSTKDDIERSTAYQQSIKKLQQDIVNVTKTADDNLDAYKTLEAALVSGRKSWLKKVVRKILK